MPSQERVAQIKSSLNAASWERARRQHQLDARGLTVKAPATIVEKTWAQNLGKEKLNG